ncbi:PLP-dependent aminotransferase family protein [Paenibacillus silvae]|uniref:MocR-like pyridoxine biosynthesis transcription factor PdxR n=1 Tax=Paenibacillus silvae TaxID=1325358 RepID=UPI0020049279|nr:PLP-dependent aminotransferase family protein [Paenibacillus silvae]MCK6075888.1 PLP-dependent aminotransferase family protein [Paenibacillus silvae]MCK6150277.1 PLP-dependent aminotransferase family protein [Paenibacillus silvae]MCK6268575.1 PLP-dependent aminotransferase family protein [Paenibacillus silvae]
MIQLPKLDEHNSRPVFVQLSDHMKQEILCGALAAHSRLPSVRKLAELLGLSTTPVEWAYQQLIAEGYVYSEPRKGYRVRAVVEGYHDILLGKSSMLTNAPAVSSDTQRLRPVSDVHYDFHMSQNDFTLFPYAKWQQYANRVWREESHSLLFYGDPQGEWGLRSEIADYLGQFRGVRCTPEQVVIGAEQHLLMSLLTQTMLQKGGQRSIAVENPGYRLLPGTFRNYGYEVIPISLDSEGINLDELTGADVSVAGVSPSHQFPMGVTMPISRRLALLDWAERAGTYLIEDDYDGEFRYSGRPIPSMQGLRENTPVIYMGGFSQVLAPAFCVHYMVLPKELLPYFAEVYRTVLFEQSASRHHQRTLELFMREGELGKHIRKMRHLYKRKRDLIVQAIQQHFGDQPGMQIQGEHAGFHLILRLINEIPAKDMVNIALDAGIRVASTEYLWANDSTPADGKRELMIGFAGIEPENIEPGIAALARIWRA